MSERVDLTLQRRVSDLAGDCRIDAEDAHAVVDAAMEGTGEIRTHRKRIIDLMRRCSDGMDADAFEVFAQALKGKRTMIPNRVLLKTGDRGEEVRQLRESLSAVGSLLCNRNMIPGPGGEYDAAVGCAVRAFQAFFRQPVTGVLDSRTLNVLNFALRETDHPLLDPERQSPPPRDIILHFYPGEQRMLVKQGDKVLDAYDMRGGPRQVRSDNDGRHTWGPTPSGRYRIARTGPHVSKTWKYSQIPWGARIRERDGVIQFQTKEDAPWQNATGSESVFKSRGPDMQLKTSDFHRDGKLIEKWESNDFGHKTGYLERNGRRANHMIHATPAGERRYGDETYELRLSHGCEHMRPHDLDEVLAKGYLRPGVEFVVHEYSEKTNRSRTSSR